MTVQRHNHHDITRLEISESNLECLMYVIQSMNWYRNVYHGCG